MLNLSGMLRAPCRQFEVTLRRKPTINAEQNARLKVTTVKAHTPQEARELAERAHPAFKASSVRVAA